MAEKENLAFCPYCIGHSAQSIVCEGMMTNPKMVQRFASGREKSHWYLHVCCNSRCMSLCAAAAALTALLDDDEKDLGEAVRAAKPPRRPLSNAAMRRKATLRRRMQHHLGRGSGRAGSRRKREVSAQSIGSRK